MAMLEFIGILGQIAGSLMVIALSLMLIHSLYESFEEKKRRKDEKQEKKETL